MADGEYDEYLIEFDGTIVELLPIGPGNRDPEHPKAIVRVGRGGERADTGISFIVCRTCFLEAFEKAELCTDVERVETIRLPKKLGGQG